MASQVLFCAGCNAKYQAKSADPGKTYKCPRCGEPLKLAQREKGAETDGALDP